MMREEDFKNIEDGTLLATSIFGTREYFVTEGVPFFNYDCDDPGWEVATNNGIISIENEIDVIDENTLAKRIEQAYYDRGEYEMPVLDKLETITDAEALRYASDTRENAIAIIRDKLVDNDTDKISMWISDQLAELDMEDEVYKELETLQKDLDEYEIKPECKNKQNEEEYELY